MSHRSCWETSPPLRNPTRVAGWGPTSPWPSIWCQGRGPSTLYALRSPQCWGKQEGWRALQSRPHRLGNSYPSVPATGGRTSDPQFRGSMEVGQTTGWYHYYQHMRCLDRAHGWFDKVEYSSGACTTRWPGSYWSIGCVVFCSVS